MSLFRILLSVALPVAAAGCAAVTGSEPGAPARLSAEGGSHLAVSAGAAGGSLAVRVVDDRGRGVPNVPVEWTAAGGGRFALETPITTTDGRGRAVVIVVPGTRTGSGWVRGRTLTVDSIAEVVFQVDVEPGPLASLTASPAAPEVGRMTNVTLTVSGHDAYGNPVQPTGLQYSSTRPDVAAVDGAGVVATRAAGEAVVRIATGAIALDVPFTVGGALLDDDFDRENGGRPHVSHSGFDAFRYWTVTAGGVDLIGEGSDYDFFPGRGLYVDLDGYYAGGTLRSRWSFTLQPGTYDLSYDLAGSQRGDANTVRITLGSLLSQTVTLPSAAPFQRNSHVITVAQPTTVHLQFVQEGNDGYGLLLDDVLLTAR